MNASLQLADIDELVLRCRGQQAKNYIGEAVACYKAGAFRSAIVSCWIGLVFDVIHKLRELELSGDKQAKDKLAEFEKIVDGGGSKLKDALEFERGLLDMVASEFEMLTTTEVEELKRLQEDRNRCAHPSMQAIDEPYRPSAELTRYHLRNAVDLMLSREPVQGKAAMDRVFGEVKSEYFPKTVEDAIEYFKDGPIRRARSSLVRNLLIGLAKGAIRDGSLHANERRRVAVAFGAIFELNREVSEACLQTELPKILGGISDDQYPNVFYLIYWLPCVYELCGKANQGKIDRCIDADNLKGDHEIICIAGALGVEKLRSKAIRRAYAMAPGELNRLLIVPRLKKHLLALKPELIVDFRTKVGSFRFAESFCENVILPLADQLSTDDIKEILNSVQVNSQILRAGGIPALLVELFHSTDRLRGDDSLYWREFGEWINGQKTQGRLSVRYDRFIQTLKENGLLDKGVMVQTEHDTDVDG